MNGGETIEKNMSYKSLSYKKFYKVLKKLQKKKIEVTGPKKEQFVYAFRVIYQKRCLTLKTL